MFFGEIELRDDDGFILIELRGFELGGDHGLG